MKLIICEYNISDWVKFSQICVWQINLYQFKRISKKKNQEKLKEAKKNKINKIKVSTEKESSVFYVVQSVCSWKVSDQSAKLFQSFQVKIVFSDKNIATVAAAIAVATAAKMIAWNDKNILSTTKKWSFALVVCIFQSGAI